MRTAYISIYSFLLLFLLATACGPTKNNFVNRHYQHTLARYNGYFNAREKLKESVKTLQASHLDDFTRVLDVYPYATDKEAKAQLPQMDEIYKKSSNVIQKRPISRWVDDSYMLVGKSHFFKRDFFAALEAFQFVNARYKNTPIAKEAEVWVVKCYLFMDKLGEAEAVVSLLLSEKNFPKEYQSFLHATAAAVYIKQEKYSSALDQMKLAVLGVKGKDKKVRYNYILGQLYEKAGKNKLAIFHYKQVIKYTPSYEFEFNAKLNIAKLYDPRDKNAAKQVRRYFRKLLRDDKNKNYLDQIYYELGNIEYREKNLPEAIKNYKLSLGSSQGNQKQKSLSYLALAKLYFNLPDYPLAQAYYDSLANYMAPDFPDYKKIMDIRLVLSDLIKNLQTIQNEDSLQAMARLSPEELERKINFLAERDKQQKIKEAKNKKNKDEQAGQVPQNTPPPSSGIGQWYFYNPVTVNMGKTDFQRRWGERPLEDNWRLSSREKELSLDGGGTTSTDSSSSKDSTKANEEKEEDLISKIPLDKQKYYQNLPTSSKALKESNDKIKEAMYNLGIIYEEKLNDYKEAIKTYEGLLKRFPGSQYEPEVYYRLHKIYKEQKDEKQAEKYKNLLLEKYPLSDYALILGDKLGNRDNTGDKQLNKFYQETYEQFSSNNCNLVFQRCAESDRLYPGSVLKPKFDLLSALCVGKSYGNDSMSVSLKNVMETYPGSDVAKKAKEILDAMKTYAERRIQDSIKALQPKDTVVKASSNKLFEFGSVDERHFYAVVLPIGSIAIGDLKVKVSDYNSEYHQLENLQISALLLDDKNQLFVVKEFPNDRKAYGYLEEFAKTNKIYEIMGIKEYQHFIISSTNFVKLLRSKNLQEYLDLYKQKFK